MRGSPGRVVLVSVDMRDIWEPSGEIVSLG